MLESSSIYPLGPSVDAADWQITTAGTYIGVWADDLAGLDGVAAQLRFAWGSAGTSVRVCLQSSLDQGVTAYDVAVVDFATISRSVIFAVTTGTTAIVLPGEGGVQQGGSQETEGVITSVLGDRFRLKVIVVGTYVNTTLSARIMPR
jgi:hypothetical protein